MRDPGKSLFPDRIFRGFLPLGPVSFKDRFGTDPLLVKCEFAFVAECEQYSTARLTKRRNMVSQFWRGRTRAEAMAVLT